MEKNVVELYNEEKFEELQELTNELSSEELFEQIKDLSENDLVDIFTKFSLDVQVAQFLYFDTGIKKFLVDNLNDIDFLPFSEKLLEIDDVENKISKEIFSDILIRSQVDARHNKLLEIIDGIENKKFALLKPILSELEPVDIAEIINDVDEEKICFIFRLLPKDLASEVFVEMDSEAQKVLISAFTDKELSNIVNDLFADDTLDIIEEMPSNVARRMLKVANNDTRELINKLLGYPKDSAGTIMTPECITLRSYMTVDDALKKIRRQALDKETIYTCYVTDSNKVLLGIVSVKDILLHEPEDKIGDFMQENFIFAQTNTDKEDVANLLSKYDLLAVPIVDSENRIVGIVTVDDAIDVITEEASEDISKIAAIVPTTKPYLQTSVFTIFRSRLPWLLILLISATFTGLIINTFEGNLNALSPLLFACVPMLMDSGGNAGSQASVTIIRSLALDEVQFKDILRVVWKEIRVAVMLALILSIACFAKLQLIDKLLFGYDYTFSISLVVSLALFCTICIAKIVGCCLPLLAKKCKLDPAVVASPFITTIVDAISLILFCTLAIAIL
ncbi:MAG: magnesium transporter [Clostridia bacterium]|nr:magnesium transporter [Clostridia bacterium]